MSTIEFSSDHSLILESINGFCRQYDRNELRKQLNTPHGYDDSLWQQWKQMSMTGITIPEAFGGGNSSLALAIPIMECLGQTMLSLPFSSSLIVEQLLLRAATTQQKEKWLPKLAQGNSASLAHLDNEDWFSPKPQLILQKSSNDTWVFHGSKQMVSNGLIAHFFIVSCLVEQYPCWVIVERSNISEHAITPATLIDETKRAVDINFDGVQVNSANIMPSLAYQSSLTDILLIGALLTASESVGSCKSALDSIISYLQTRLQFGKPIGSFQSLKHVCVDILIRYNDAKSFIYHTATLLERHHQNEGVTAPLNQEIETACRMAKICATEALNLAGDRAIQFHGAMGFTYECDAQLFLRRSIWLQQQFGDDIYHRSLLTHHLKTSINKHS